MRTDLQALLRSSGPGYRTLFAAPGEQHLDLAGEFSGGDAGTPMLTLAHLSDLHVCDAQSPVRVEYLDRWADPDSPIRDRIARIGTYRPQEGLTTQVVEAAVRAINDVAVGPVGGGAVDLAVVTGDNTDNAQANELDWYLRLLEGGVVTPDSGDPERWEGIDAFSADERFWHPDDGVVDRLKLRGFSVVPGYTDAARRAFAATGLRMPWLAVHGNHDQMLQGTVPADTSTRAAATGTRKVIALPMEWSDDEVVELLVGLAACDPAAVARLGQARAVRITADPRRRIVSRSDFVAAHFGPAARPLGHGFGAINRRDGTAYYRYDHGRMTLLTLDTVDEHGGWEGSLDQAQLAWLEDQLTQADRDRRYVVLASHHPLRHLINNSGPHRVLAAEVAATLSRHPSLVLWLNGHSHRSRVVSHHRFWEITTPSLIDWPQQARLVEILQHGDGRLLIATTMLDHSGKLRWSQNLGGPLGLAGLSRELAANDRKHNAADRAGNPSDRNVLLSLANPFHRQDVCATRRARQPMPHGRPASVATAARVRSN